MHHEPDRMALIRGSGQAELETLVTALRAFVNASLADRFQEAWDGFTAAYDVLQQGDHLGESRGNDGGLECGAGCGRRLCPTDG